MSKKLIVCGYVSVSVFIFNNCASAPTGADSNANTAVVVAANTANMQVVNIPANAPPAATNSAVPGIPNAPANMKIQSDPTKDAKVQQIGNPAPDNSEVFTALGQNLVRTRVFKNNAQIAKVEETTEYPSNKKTVVVFLRSGQAKELPEGKIPDAMNAPASEILQAASNAPAAKTEAKPNAETKTGEQKPIVKPGTDKKQNR